MHPAYSVIVFTTTSGAGYGLLIWLSVALLGDFAQRDPVFGVVGLGLALALITIGLLASTLHLGRPERAWRALSQWRTSWLSREGVASIATYIPAGVLGIGWLFGELFSGQIAIGAALSVLCALATLWCTGKIYSSLPTIRAWHQPLVSPIYILLALSTGGILLTLLLAAFGRLGRFAALGTVITLFLGFIAKRRYWTAIDTAPTHTAESATGLGHLGTVRPLDPPHTQPNYVMREMGYQVARRHAIRLRLVAAWLLFLVPLIAELVLLYSLPRPAQIAVAAAATLSTALGLLVERWLFFAEAEHVVVVYYRGGSA
jgi:DMSO reductase anchor subunit